LRDPKALLAFSKNLSPLISLGASVRYVEHNVELSDKIHFSKHKGTMKDFRAQIGVKRELASGVILGALLGYDWFKPDDDSYFSDYYPGCRSFWLSGHSVVDIENRLKMGVEAMFKFRRGDFGPYFTPGSKGKKENYYFSSLKFRGIYDLSSKLRVGVLYVDNELFGAFFDPLINTDFVLPYYEAYVRHLGGGCSYKFGERVLAGAEYHFRDASRPDEIKPSLGWKNESLNLGVEGRVTETFALRTGLIRTENNWNPNYDRQRDTWENTLTFGFAYEHEEFNLILEFAYGYAFKKFKQWPGAGDMESDKQTFSLSFKKTL